MTDEELRRIGELANKYAFSPEHAQPAGGSMGTPRAISKAAVDVLEGTSRELHRETSEGRDLIAEEDALRRLNIDHVPMRPGTRQRLQASGSSSDE